MGSFDFLFGEVKKIYFSIPDKGIIRASLKYVGDKPTESETRMEIVREFYDERGISVSPNQIVFL